MARVRDRQRSRCYYMEHTLLPRGLQVTPSVATQMCHDMLAGLGLLEVSELQLRTTRRRSGSSYYVHDTQSIYLNVNHCYESVVIHELAHHVCHLLRLDADGAHGPTFVTVLIEMIMQWFGTGGQQVRRADDPGHVWPMPYTTAKVLMRRVHGLSVLDRPVLRGLWEGQVWYDE